MLPGAHDPVHAPFTHAWFEQVADALQFPFASHVCTPVLLAHCLGARRTRARARPAHTRLVRAGNRCAPGAGAAARLDAVVRALRGPGCTRPRAGAAHAGLVGAPGRRSPSCRSASQVCTLALPEHWWLPGECRSPCTSPPLQRPLVQGDGCPSCRWSRRVSTPAARALRAVRRAGALADAGDARLVGARHRRAPCPGDVTRLHAVAEALRGPRGALTLASAAHAGLVGAQRRRTPVARGVARLHPVARALTPVAPGEHTPEHAPEAQTKEQAAAAAPGAARAARLDPVARRWRTACCPGCTSRCRRRRRTRSWCM